MSISKDQVDAIPFDRLAGFSSEHFVAWQMREGPALGSGPYAQPNQ
jgi:hypothetical protein